METLMSRVVRSDPKQHPQFEPLYDIDANTGATIEVFYADRVLAKSFGIQGTGWCWWSCQRGCLPGQPIGPFGSSYRAYRDALDSTRQRRSDDRP
jgi:hypothetical protein